MRVRYTKRLKNVNPSADSTVISTIMWIEFGKPQLDGNIRGLEAYEGHQLTLV